MLEILKEKAFNCHRDTNHYYDDKPYEYHLQMVADFGKKFIHLIPEEFRENVLTSCYFHDTIEDCRITYGDLLKMTCFDVAEIVYALTNEKGKTRKERANDKYYEGIRNVEFATFVKMCDRIANVEYSLSKDSGMASMYKKETPEFINKIYDSRYDEMFNHLREITGLVLNK